MKPLLTNFLMLAANVAFTCWILVYDGQQPRHWVYVTCIINSAGLAWILRGLAEQVRRRRMMRAEIERFMSGLKMEVHFMEVPGPEPKQDERPH